MRFMPRDAPKEALSAFHPGPMDPSPPSALRSRDLVGLLAREWYPLE